MLALLLQACITQETFRQQLAQQDCETYAAYFAYAEVYSDNPCGDYEREEYTAADIRECVESQLALTRDSEDCDVFEKIEWWPGILHCRIAAGECESFDAEAARACLESLSFAECEDIPWDDYFDYTWTYGQEECPAVCPPD